MPWIQGNQAGGGHYFVPARNPRLLVVYCHAYGTLGKDVPYELLALQHFGYPIISTDLGGSATWGSDTARDLVESARVFGKAQAGLTSNRFVLIGGSMGALTALNFARTTPQNIAAIVLCTPLVTLAAAYFQHPGTIATAIATAYGNVTKLLAGGQAVLNSHDPSQHYAELPKVPIAVFHHADDPWFLPADVAAMRAAIPQLEYHDLTGDGYQGHTFDGITARMVARFLEGKT